MQFPLALYTLTSACRFSILFFVHLLRCYQGEFVWPSRVSLVGDQFPLCLWLKCLIQEWCFKEKVDVGYSEGLKVYWGNYDCAVVRVSSFQSCNACHIPSAEFLWGFLNFLYFWVSSLIDKQLSKFRFNLQVVNKKSYSMRVHCFLISVICMIIHCYILMIDLLYVV